MVILIFYFFLALVAIFFNKIKRRYISFLKFSPTIKRITIIIPVKNEQERLKITLNALEKQNYKNFEVTIADDHSEDLTYNNSLVFIKRNSNFKIITVDNKFKNLSSKQNAIDQAIMEAESDIIFSTDAGCYIGEDFTQDLNSLFTDDTDMIICQPCTLGSKNNLVSKLQVFSEELLSTLFMFGIIYNNAFAGKGSGIAIKKSTYLTLGGYQKTGYSLIEDEALIRLFQKNGKKITAGCNLVVKKQIKDNFKSLLEQHRRWIRGAINSYTSISFLLVSGYYILSLYSLYITLKFKPFILLKYFFEYLFITAIYKNTEDYSFKNSLIVTILTPLYFIFITTYAIIPTKIKWK